MIKVLFFTLLAFTSLFYGCKKSEAAIIDTDVSLYNVSFSVSKFSVKTDAATTSTDSLKNFEYYIYTQEGTRVRSFDKKLINSGSSIEVKENLEPGNYKFVFFSSEQSLDRHINDAPGEIPGFIYANTFDVYHKAVDITVDITGKIKQTILLDKLNSALEFDFMDEHIPINISSILITWYDNKYVDFNGISFTPGRKQKSIKIDPQNKRIEKFSTSIFNTSDSFNVYISYIDTNGRSINNKEISNVKCFKNQKTTLACYLFDQTPKEFVATLR